MNNNRIFVLGALDPEMQEIERVLTEQGESFVYAMCGMRRVLPLNAYSAYRTSGPVPSDADIVFVECGVMGLTYSTVIDHHRPGDPGYGKLPADFMEGSSLSQLLTMLELDPTERQRVICAADHCLNHAYRGRCPGVSTEALIEFRESSRCAFRSVATSMLRSQIEDAHAALLKAEKCDILGTQVAWPEQVDTFPEMSEASARYGIPYMYSRPERDGRTKMGIRGASAPVIREWMTAAGSALFDLYGDPERGFAGGYNAAA